MKALEAINTLIILILGIVTLLAVAALLTGGFSSSRGGISLETATQTTCKKINPAFCREPGKSARMPVFDFDANKRNGTNEHSYNLVTNCVYCDQDTFEALCHFYYGGPTPCSAPWPEENFINKCMVELCGCPKYNYPDDYVNTCP